MLPKLARRDHDRPAAALAGAGGSVCSSSGSRPTRAPAGRRPPRRSRSAPASSSTRALFLWAGLVTSHPLALGLLYVFVWEGLFGTFVNGIKYLSIRQYALGIATVVDGSRFSGPDQDVLGGTASIVGAPVVAVGFTLLAVRRLRRMDVP